MTSPPPTCPRCRTAMKYGGLVLCGREDDGRRVCRTLWRCSRRHLWWAWADRPEAPLEPCPHPELFRR
ncbi:dehydrogenase [Streptomyces sp. HUAS ZL42]|uniref:dehydrogenase n=1 Tax=Streptomyces sp. HUAS ZL42 TaxID=3231715 RepID=UPI00345E9841